MKQPITLFHMSFLFILIISVHFYLIAVPIILEDAKRDAWLSVIMSSFIACIWMVIIYFIIAMLNGQSIFQFLDNHYGKPITNILRTSLLIYFFVILLISLKSVIDIIKSIYFPMTPIWIIACLFMIFAFYATILGFRSVIMIAGVLFPVFILLSIFSIFFNIKYTDISYLLPFIENGIRPVFNGGINNLLAFSEFTWLLLLAHYVQHSKKKRTYIIMLAIVTFVMLITMIQGITSFGPVQAANHLFLYYEEWRLIRVNKFLEHIDFFSIFIWMGATFIRVSLILFIIGDLIMITVNKKRWILFILSLITVLFMLIPISSDTFQDWIKNYFSVISTLFLLAFTLFAGMLIAWKRRKKQYAT